MNTNGSILKEENKIKNEYIEHVLVFSQEGKLLVRASGTKGQVTLRDGDIDLLPDSITSHNHPQGTSFSLTDIRTTLICGIKEAHVVTSNNITYVLEITDDTVYDYVDFDILEEEYDRLHREYYDSIILGSPYKKHRSNYQKLFSRILTDLFENIEGINYYEIGEYKEWRAALFISFISKYIL